MSAESQPLQLLEFASQIQGAHFKDSFGQDCVIKENPSGLCLGVNRNWAGQRIEGQMVLSQQQAGALLPLLAHYVQTGKLPHATE